MIMKVAEKGNTVKVHYTGRLENGDTFDSSEGSDPLEFTIGEQQVIAGFESAVIGMPVGETKTVTIEAAEAYGEPISDLVTSVERARFPDNVELVVGQGFVVGHTDGEEMMVIVTEMTDTHVTIDANHPLAGKDLTFEITVNEIT